MRKFERNDESTVPLALHSARDKESTITLDQVGMVDLGGTLGIGGYMYGMVICKLRDRERRNRFWAFTP